MSRSESARRKPSGAALHPPDATCAWTAEIEWGRGDGETGFSARARRDPREEPFVLAESPPLQWPPAGEESVAAVTSAVTELEASLIAAGWRPLSPGGSWYAKRFEWRAVEDDGEAGSRRLQLVTAPEHAERPGGAFARTPRWPDGTAALWRCEIDWRAGWSESRFEAMLYRPRGRRGRAIGGTAPAKWLLMRQPDAEAPEMRSAVQRLAACLVAAGWSPAGTGLNWYSQRFVWRRESTPPDHVQPVSPAPGPER